jgi:hypothetical protein
MTTSAHDTPALDQVIPAPRVPVEQVCPRCHQSIEVVRDPAAAATSPQTDGWLYVEHAHRDLRTGIRRRALRCRASGHNRWTAEHGW